MEILEEPRGFRNNNPGNIRHGDDWVGLSDEQSDTAFCSFKVVDYGIRAIFKLLHTYRTKYNLNTIEDIINRWAPMIENDTESYIDSVSYRTKIRGNEILSDDDIVNIVEAIIYHENGVNPFSLRFIEKCSKL